MNDDQAGKSSPAPVARHTGVLARVGAASAADAVRRAARRTASALRAGVSRVRSGRWYAVLDVVAIWLTILSVIGLVSHWVTYGRAATLFLAATSPYLARAAIPAFVLFALRGRKSGAIVSAAALIVAIGVQLPLYVAADAPRHSVDVTVMTANLRYGGANADEVVAAARRHHVDVLMLEELTRAEQDRLLAAGLAGVLPYAISAPGSMARGVGLWSRFRLRTPATVGGFTFPVVTARIAPPGIRTPVTVAALHLAGPVPDATAWRRDIARLPSELRALRGPGATIVGGDFNSTPDTAQFRALLTGGYRDAAEQSGAGYTATWPANEWYPPVIAIDHVLTRGAVARDASTVEIAGTDHRALVVRVALPR